MCTRRLAIWACAVGLVASFSFTVWAGDDAAAGRGWEWMTRQTLTPPIWSTRAHENAWKQWGLDEKPADYLRLYRERYGLHAAPYENNGFPLGLRKAMGFFGPGITQDCLVCHAGSVAGQTIIGLGNASLDLQALYEENIAADGFKLEGFPTVSNVRGTFEAVASVTYLMQFRHPDLTIRPPIPLTYREDLCEDIPPWWNVKRKKTMYFNGGGDTRSVRSIMTFMLSPLNSADFIKKQESAFADIRAYIMSLEAPKYPFEIDSKLANEGRRLFNETCAKCHGTYGPGGKYPNRIVPLDEIGTDPSLAKGFSPEFAEHYKNSWFAQEKGAGGESYVIETDGYQAPPLDGVWATAPYLHNASVPTVYHLLNSKSRPRVFTRSYRTEREDYDPERLGWKIRVLEGSPDSDLPAIERRKIYDTTQVGRGNGGHIFGDKFTEAERMAVIEYLKTL